MAKHDRRTGDHRRGRPRRRGDRGTSPTLVADGAGAASAGGRERLRGPRPRMPSPSPSGSSGRAPESRARHVVLGIASRRILVREYTTAAMRPDLLRQALPFQVQDLLPVPAEQAVLDFYPVSEEAGQVTGLLVAAVAESVEQVVRTIGEGEDQGRRRRPRPVRPRPGGAARSSPRRDASPRCTSATTRAMSSCSRRACRASSASSPSTSRRTPSARGNSHSSANCRRRRLPRRRCSRPCLAGRPSGGPAPQLAPPVFAPRAACRLRPSTTSSCGWPAPALLH